MAEGLRHRRGVDAREGDGPFVRRPPMAVETVHFLLGDEIGQPVRHRAAAVAGEALLAAARRPHVQVAGADKADGCALRGQADAGLAAAGRRQRLRNPVGDGHQMRAAVGNKENSLAVGMPRVGRDTAVKLAPALAFGAFLGAHRRRRRGVHGGLKPSRAPGGQVHQPQFEPLAVARHGAQIACPLAVRGQLDAAGHRPGERQAAEQGLQCQLHIKRKSQPSSAANAGRVRFSAPSAVTTTLSSMRIPPQGRRASTFGQSTSSAASDAARTSSSVGMK